MSRPVTVILSKQNALNENIQIQVELDTSKGRDIGAEWEKLVVPALAKLDARMHEMNMRVIRLHERAWKLDPVHQRHIQNVLAITAGPGVFHLAPGVEQFPAPEGDVEPAADVKEEVSNG